MSDLAKIAVFSGPTATIQNTPPLVTSNKARASRDLPRLTGPAGAVLPFDSLRPQRLAAPVTVYVEQHTAHPLEDDAADLYGPPDAWINQDGTVAPGPIAGAKPAYRIVLEPDDGLYLLPYMAAQADGAPWDDATAHPGAPQSQSRQTFFPDASRMYEEIDRFGVNGAGHNNLLSRL